MKLFLSLLIVLLAANTASAKLSCSEGILSKNNQALTSEEVASMKTKIETKLAKINDTSKEAKDPEKRAQKQTKFTNKLALINSCTN